MDGVQTGAPSTSITSESPHGQTVTEMPGGDLKPTSALPSTAQQSSAPTDSARALDDVAIALSQCHIHEAPDQSSTLRSDRPLSHQEMVERWSQTLGKMDAARRSFVAVQEEFDDYASDIIEIIGPQTYEYFYALYLRAVTAKMSTR